MIEFYFVERHSFSQANDNTYVCSLCEKRKAEGKRVDEIKTYMRLCLLTRHMYELIFLCLMMVANVLSSANSHNPWAELRYEMYTTDPAVFKCPSSVCGFTCRGSIRTIRCHTVDYCHFRDEFRLLREQYDPGYTAPTGVLKDRAPAVVEVTAADYRVRRQLLMYLFFFFF